MASQKLNFATNLLSNRSNPSSLRECAVFVLPVGLIGLGIINFSAMSISRATLGEGVCVQIFPQPRVLDSSRAWTKLNKRYDVGEKGAGGHSPGWWSMAH